MGVRKVVGFVGCRNTVVGIEGWVFADSSSFMLFIFG